MLSLSLHIYALIIRAVRGREYYTIYFSQPLVKKVFFYK